MRECLLYFKIQSFHIIISIHKHLYNCVDTVHIQIVLK